MVLEVNLFFQNHSLTNIHIRTNWRELPLVTKSKCKGSEYQWHTPIWTLRRSLHAAFHVETYKNNIAFSNGGSSHWWVGHPITDHSLWSTPLCKQDKQAKSPDSSGFIVTTFTWEQRDLSAYLHLIWNITALPELPLLMHSNSFPTSFALASFTRTWDVTHEYADEVDSYSVQRLPFFGSES